MTLKYKRILVAIDGSKEADWAFKKSIEISKRNDAALNLIYVVDTRSFSAMTKSVPHPEDRIFDHGKELLNNYKKDALEAGISSVHVYVVPGSPDKVISRDYAKRLDIDLIVCGAQGLNAIEQYILGSVSQHIVSSSPCDVLVVRREQKTEE